MDALLQPALAAHAEQLRAEPPPELEQHAVPMHVEQLPVPQLPVPQLPAGQPLALGLASATCAGLMCLLVLTSVLAPLTSFPAARSFSFRAHGSVLSESRNGCAGEGGCGDDVLTVPEIL